MNKLTINPSNRKYYSSEYIKGWEDGAKAQYETRPKGKWIILDGKIVCSECNETHYETNFCPHCGADTRCEVM